MRTPAKKSIYYIVVWNDSHHYQGILEMMEAAVIPFLTLMIMLKMKTLHMMISSRFCSFNVTGSSFFLLVTHQFYKSLGFPTMCTHKGPLGLYFESPVTQPPCIPYSAKLLRRTIFMDRVIRSVSQKQFSGNAVSRAL